MIEVAPRFTACGLHWRWAGGADDRGQRLLRGCAAPGAIASTHLAGDDGGANGLFGAPVGDVDGGVAQEVEQRRRGSTRGSVHPVARSYVPQRSHGRPDRPIAHCSRASYSRANGTGPYRSPVEAPTGTSNDDETRDSKYPPAKPGALVVSRSKRPDVAATRGHLGHLYRWPPSSNRSWSCRRSSSSCSRMYARITRSSRPTVDTKYPRAQKCCPTKLRGRPPNSRAM